jgi:hypothetical protein
MRAGSLHPFFAMHGNNAGQKSGPFEQSLLRQLESFVD